MEPGRGRRPPRRPGRGRRGDLYSTRTSDEGSEFPHDRWRALLDHARRTLAVDPAWTAAVPRDASPEGTARALAAAGCDHPTLLRALTEPVHPAETAWVLELLTGRPRDLLADGTRPA
ncbi:hypothetical protein AB0I60_34285 [Actinosynnema sp. NPDC050436]|uniref:hypothetical protein n=1 Tax=Actinosynnema sp. NPDC050436 TaxID=3155659 RepID=UPI0033E58C82